MPADLNNMTRICSCYHRSQGASRLPARLREVVDLPAWASRLRSSRVASCQALEVSHWLKFAWRTDRILNRASAGRIIAQHVWYSRSDRPAACQNRKIHVAWPTLLRTRIRCILHYVVTASASSLVFRKYLHGFLELITLAGMGSFTLPSLRDMTWHDDSFFINLCRLQQIGKLKISRWESTV